MTNQVSGNRHKMAGRVLLVYLLAFAAAQTAMAADWALGAPFLTIWPSARAAALAGAISALTDGPDAAAWNPGALGFLPGVEFGGTGGEWGTGLSGGMEKYDAGISVALPRMGVQGLPLAFGLNTSYLYLGYGVVGGSPELGPNYRGDVSPQVGALLRPNLGVGVGAKFIHSVGLFYEGMGVPIPEPGLGVDYGGTGTACACDVGAVYRPVNRVSFGLALTNLGPRIEYLYTSMGGDIGTPEFLALPSMVRFGACYTPVDQKVVRGKVMLELDKVLPQDGYYQGFLRSIWKSVAAEVTLFKILSLRAGYMEDLDWQRGGVLVDAVPDGQRMRVGLGDMLVNHGAYRFRSVGLTWGFGLGYHDLIRLDVSNDGAIYLVPTPNWRFALESRDVAGLVRAIADRR
jgi:hypothetical protein